MVDDKALAKVYRVLNNADMRVILQRLGINGAMSYSEIMEDNKKINGYNGSSKTAYYIKHLKFANMLTVDDATKKYFLSRIGVQSLDVISNFEKICMSYDLSDADADGKIEFEYKIKGRKL
jgi:hypothetical protein